MENNISVINYLVSLDLTANFTDVLISAVENHALKNLKWLFEYGFPVIDYDQLFDAALATHKSIRTIKYLLSVGFVDSDSL